MKKLFLALLILMGTQTFAQVDGNYNYSIGVRAFNVMQLPKILQQSNTEDYTSTWVNGGLIRFNDNQMSFRISGYYLYKGDLTFNNKCDNCETAKGTMNDWAIKLGFEKNFNYGIIQPYFATDLGFRANNFNGDIYPKNNSSTPYVGISSKNGVTVSPILGLRFNVAKQISLYTEASMDFYYAYERQETIANDAALTRTFAKYNKLEGLLNPFSIGLQIHLVGKN